MGDLRTDAELALKAGVDMDMVVGGLDRSDKARGPPRCSTSMWRTPALDVTHESAARRPSRKAGPRQEDRTTRHERTSRYWSFLQGGKIP